MTVRNGVTAAHHAPDLGRREGRVEEERDHAAAGHLEGLQRGRQQEQRVRVDPDQISRPEDLDDDLGEGLVRLCGYQSIKQVTTVTAVTAVTAVADVTFAYAHGVSAGAGGGGGSPSRRPPTAVKFAKRFEQHPTDEVLPPMTPAPTRRTAGGGRFRLVDQLWTRIADDDEPLSLARVAEVAAGAGVLETHLLTKLT